MRIVYIEDNFPNQSLVQRIVAGANHEVITYPTAEDALFNFDNLKPDMVLVDVELAGPMTGLDFVRKIRSAGHRLPVVAITAVSAKQECLDAGCDAFFVKPVPVREFFEYVQEHAAKLA